MFRDSTYSTEVRADVGYFDSNTGIACYGDGSGEAQDWCKSGVNKRMTQRPRDLWIPLN
ncbi:hypothetical protein [Paraburkholderia rhynchosiae]|uniref:hypothetical protein n=1 Tax=Paraburkholderia rhynchosiae TaxID=487049 RepID=UPI001304D4C5|nr:hypothetical protein [Paraburkholderia rhynchosiae]